MLRHFGKLVVASTILLFCQPALAQTGNSGSVEGAGTIVLQPKATALRLQLSITVQGDDMQTTLTRIDRKGEAVRQALLKAKADPKSTALDGPRLVGALRALGELVPQRRQYWGKGKVPQQQPPQYKSQPPASPRVEAKRMPRITLLAHLKAEWPLHAETASELLVEADRIVLLAHERLKQFRPEKKSPQSEPSQDQPASPFDVEPFREVSVPQYLFVGRIAGEEVRQAQIKAFEKATADATADAEIAGYRIGPLLNLYTYLPDSRGSDSDPFASASPFAPPSGIAPAILTARETDVVKLVEITASEPSSIRFRMQVRAKFRLQQSIPAPETNR